MAAATDSMAASTFPQLGGLSVSQPQLQAGHWYLVHAEGGHGSFQHRFDVYGREGEPCRGEGCSGVVARIVQGGRSTFFCPSCQKR